MALKRRRSLGETLLEGDGGGGVGDGWRAGAEKHKLSSKGQSGSSRESERGRERERETILCLWKRAGKLRCSKCPSRMRGTRITQMQETPGEDRCIHLPENSTSNSSTMPLKMLCIYVFTSALFATVPVRRKPMDQDRNATRNRNTTDLSIYCASLYLFSCMEMALILVSHVPIRRDGSTYRPLGSVCFDHLGVHRITVEAHCGGKCSSNMQRYQ